jgi:hypothetical protein
MFYGIILVICFFLGLDIYKNHNLFKIGNCYELIEKNPFINKETKIKVLDIKDEYVQYSTLPKLEFKDSNVIYVMERNYKHVECEE